MSAFKDLSGNRYGRLLVKERTYTDGKHSYWLCVCDCGNETVVCGDSLKRGATRSCGCLNSEVSSKSSMTHGMSNTRLYKSWLQMKYRCYNPNFNEFHRYGGRGIKVCDEWRDDFQSFYNWAILNGYSDDLTIDRIQTDGNYEPDNCQWLTRSDNVKKMWEDKRNAQT